MFKVTAKGNNEAEILLYDQIADFDSEKWGLISAKGLINKIKDLGQIDNITLRINSVGGDVFEAQAIYSYLKSHPANITVKIDGLAASAASFIAMAGDKVIMPRNTLMMIHNPAGGVWGQSDDMRDTAEILDKIRDTIANVYIAKTGLDREKINSMMDAETWMDADEALKLKFCDEVGEPVKISAMATKTGGFVFMNKSGFVRLDGFIKAKLPGKFIQEGNLPMPENTANQTIQSTQNGANLANYGTQPAQNGAQQQPDEIKNSFEAGYNKGIEAERERIKLLDSLNSPGREEIINKAKYEEPRDARDIAIELLQADKNNAQVNAMHKDSQVVNAALEPQAQPNAEQERERNIDLIMQNITSIRGY